MSGFLKRVHVTGVMYNEMYNQTRQEFIAANPTFTLKMWAGCVLETLEYLGK